MEGVPVIFLAFSNGPSNSPDYLRNVPKELHAIHEALSVAEKNRICEVVLKPFATLDDLVNVFQDERYRNRITIFHFGGHAGTNRLILETLEQSTTPINTEGFNYFLSTCRNLKFVFLNGCFTHTQAQNLIKAGVSLVVGTTKEIRDQRALQLASRFYSGLAEGLSIKKAWFDSTKEAIAIEKRENIRGIGLETEAKNPDRLPWEMYKKPGAEKTLELNLPELANNPLFGLPEISDDYYKRLPQEPFIHLQYFKREHAAIFFGRGNEIRNLYNQVHGPDPIILYYGQSGVGKSSLLEAGLLPRLEADYQVQYLRRNAEIGLWKTLEKSIIALLDQAEIKHSKQLEMPNLPYLFHQLESHFYLTRQK